jgi:hypothetical protein
MVTIFLAALYPAVSVQLPVEALRTRLVIAHEGEHLVAGTPPDIFTDTTLLRGITGGHAHAAGQGNLVGPRMAAVLRVLMHLEGTCGLQARSTMRTVSLQLTCQAVEAQLLRMDARHLCLPTLCAGHCIRWRS